MKTEINGIIVIKCDCCETVITDSKREWIEELCIDCYHLVYPNNSLTLESNSKTKFDKRNYQREYMKKRRTNKTSIELDTVLVNKLKQIAQDTGITINDIISDLIAQ